MARVHDVDPELIERTRRWLLDQQRADGSWDPEGHRLHDDPTGCERTRHLARLSTTAYIAWAVFAGHAGDPKARADARLSPGQSARRRSTIRTSWPWSPTPCWPSTRRGAPRGPYLDRLESLSSRLRRTASSSGGSSRLRRGGPCSTAAGASGAIETTALATLALLERRPRSRDRAGRPGLARRPEGRAAAPGTRPRRPCWPSRRSWPATGKPLGGDSPRRHRASRSTARPSARSTSPPTRPTSCGRSTCRTASTAGHSPARRSRTAPAPSPATRSSSATTSPNAADPRDGGPDAEPLTIRLDYDRTDAGGGRDVTATATVVNSRPEPAPMVILDLPIPAGFVIERRRPGRRGQGGRWPSTRSRPEPRLSTSATSSPIATLTLRYRLRAAMPVKLTVPAVASVRVLRSLAARDEPGVLADGHGEGWRGNVSGVSHRQSGMPPSRQVMENELIGIDTALRQSTDVLVVREQDDLGPARDFGQRLKGGGGPARRRTGSGRHRRSGAPARDSRGRPPGWPGGGPGRAGRRSPG